MWTQDEIESINPATLGQRRSSLKYLESVGAIDYEVLCNCASEMEAFEGSLRTFALLPFSISADQDPFTIETWGNGVPDLKLRFYQAFQELGSNGSLRLKVASQCSDRKNINTINSLTFVIGEIPLWGCRKKYYSRYLSCLRWDGLDDVEIARRESWMDLPAAASDGPLTAKDYEHELARRVKNELLYSVKKFVAAYELAQVEEVAEKIYLYGYYAMVAPGRISLGGLPKPIYLALNKSNSGFGIDLVDRKKFEQSVNSLRREKDRTVRQLLAMTRLAREGEPELALVGAVTSIESFFNSRFPEVVTVTRSGRRMSSSISKILKRQSIAMLLDKKSIDSLYLISRTRNEIVHGSPPDRDRYTNQAHKIEYVIDCIRLCLDIYRDINLSEPDVKSNK